MRDFFGQIARKIADGAGTPTAFLGALGFVLAWVLSGPVFGFSPGWQLVINTGTTIVTFLMVFLIQNAQNRDQAALQLKLDELLRAVTGARTGFVDLEDLTEKQLDQLQEQFRTLAERHAEEMPAVVADDAKRA